MLSKIENGTTSPSLSSLQALSGPQVPVTALFHGVRGDDEATFVKAGQGLTIERRGTRAGHQYQLLGHTPHGPLVVEPYIISLTEGPTFPIFQHAGLEFLHMLEGVVVYRHGDKTYGMRRATRCSSTPRRRMGRRSWSSFPSRFI